MHKLSLLDWTLGIYLILGIFYVFPPGGPQPADFLMIIIILITLSNRYFKIKNSDKPFFIFVGYTILVSAAWSMMLLDMRLYLGGLYFLYNLLVYLIFKRHQEHSLLRDNHLLFFVTVAIFLEASYLLFIETGHIRAIGTFTNPNQLSYFSLCFTSLGLMLANSKKRIFTGILILAMGWIIVLLGLSKAAMIAMFFQTVIFGVLLEKKRGMFFLFAAIASIIFYNYYGPQIDIALKRIDSIGHDSDDSIAGRGYDRIINDFEYALLGAGEGQYKRHDSMWGGEIHSSLGTILFSYGIPGILLFMIFLSNVFRQNRLGFVIYILPLILYSLTHNGLRYTPFWVCLAVCSRLGKKHWPERRNKFKTSRVVAV